MAAISSASFHSISSIASSAFERDPFVLFVHRHLDGQTGLDAQSLQQAVVILPVGAGLMAAASSCR